MNIPAPIVEPTVLVYDASWQTYIALRDSDENRHVRMTFDRGSLELMSPSKAHERVGYLIGRCIDVWTEMRRIEMQGCRTTTFRREDLQRGLELDNCYYIAHEADVRHRDETDLTIDPPPDLAIEVDVASRSLNRLAIYAALGVSEVWMWRRENLTVHLLNDSGKYDVVPESRALPRFPFDRLTTLLQNRTTIGETMLICDFREWIREWCDDAGGQ